MKIISPLVIALAVTNVLTLSAAIWLYKSEAVGDTSCNSCYEAVDCSSTFDNLDVNTAKTLIKNYNDYHYPAINSNCLSLVTALNGKKPDSKCVWYSLETLKKFIFAIESQTSTKSAPTCDKVLGVRIYFGEYPMDTDECSNMNVSKGYAGLHTLVMIPTIDDDCGGEIVHRDFDPLTYATSGTISPFSGPFMTALNHGGLTPPPYPPDTAGPGTTLCLGTDFMDMALAGDPVPDGGLSPVPGSKLIPVTGKTTLEKKVPQNSNAKVTTPKNTGPADNNKAVPVSDKPSDKAGHPIKNK